MHAKVKGNNLTYKNILNIIYLLQNHAFFIFHLSLATENNTLIITFMNNNNTIYYYVVINCAIVINSIKIMNIV